MEDLELELPKF